MNYYQGLICVLRWICELGRVNLLVSVSLMSRYLAQARLGQLEQVYHIFAYLVQYSPSKLVFDNTLPDVADVPFGDCDWTEFYPDAKEAITSSTSSSVVTCSGSFRESRVFLCSDYVLATAVHHFVLTVCICIPLSWIHAEHGTELHVSL